MVPVASIASWTLLLHLVHIPVAGLREGKDGGKSQSMVLETSGVGCDSPTATRQLLEALQYKGSLDGPLCSWPGITCDWTGCTVEELECDTCSGRLPQDIPLKRLERVSLTSPNLTGDIAVFGDLPLRRLNLQGTQVSGDIASCIRQKTQYHLPLTLLLGQTKVGGNLQGMRGYFFEHLDLEATGVTGHLDDLMTGELVSLNLARTAVVGNLSALTNAPSIRSLDLSYTRVTGRISNSWRGRCRHLESLQLKGSLVHFVPTEKLESLTDVRSHLSSRILYQLKYLDLSHCPVNSPAEMLLMPLALSSLKSLKAADAGITGAIPKLTNVPATIDGTHVSDFTCPLATSLLMLDLKQNKVSEVRDLPVQPNSGRVSLQENAPLVVSARVMKRAARDQIILDLSGTKLSNGEVVEQLLEEGAVKTTDMYAYRNDVEGSACKDLVGTVKVTPKLFLPQKLCKCLAGWHGSGATCKMCPANTFSEEMGLDTCKSCPLNSTAPEGSRKLVSCKCDFGNIHDGTCACDQHHALQGGDCVLCSKMHLHCSRAGSLASTAVPDVGHARLEANAEEARRCLSPDVSQRCPGSHQCGIGYMGTLCASCADGFWAKQGRCKPCPKASSGTIVGLVLLGVAAVFLVAFLVYRLVYGQSLQKVSAKSQLKKLLVLQAPGLLQMVQLWTVLSRLGQPQVPGPLSIPEIPYLAALQLTIDDLQSMLKLQCAFDPDTVRILAAVGSPLLPLLLLACCLALELFRAGLGVNIALKVLPFLFIGGAYSTANLLSCQLQDGDGESLGDFAFRKAIPQLRCYDRDGAGFWLNVAGYSSALAYGLLIPLCLAGLMVRQYCALYQARLFVSAYAEEEPQKISLRLQTLHISELPTDGVPKRLLAAAAAHMAVHCRGKKLVQLHNKSITIASENDFQNDIEEADEIQILSVLKVMADDDASRNIKVLQSRKFTEMLTERIMLDDAEDRLLIGSKSLLSKHSLAQDVWIYVVVKLYAVALVCCVSMSDAWKWAISFSLGMAVLVGVCQPYMWPQVTQLQSLSCLCLAVASMAFAYDCIWLARLAFLAPFLLLLWQVQAPDCTAALAERLYKELESELPKLQRGENHEVQVQKFRFGRH